jgi:polyhydroxybutyrate depolymerase
MTTVRALLALCVGALLLGAKPALAAFLPGDHTRALPFGGLVRTYRVHVPSSYDGSVPVPLVVDIHGFSSNATEQELISGMRTESDAHGFLVVYPQGLNDAWNAGICCGNTTIDDVGFIRALVGAISGEANIDPRRVYVTGLSNGGAMSQRLACDAADLFAAAVPMSFPIPLRPLSICRPVRAMPVLTMMGLTDDLVPYNGGRFGSAPATFAYWRDVDGCGSGPPDQVVERGRSRCETYTACAPGVRTGLCSIFSDSFVGTAIEGHVVYLNDDFVLADVAWQFLSSFQLPDVTAPAESVLAGRATMKIDGRRQVPVPLRWNLRLGAGTWGATTADGAPLSGSWTRKRRNRRSGDAELTSDSLAALSRALAAHVADVTGGSAVDLEPAGPLRLRTERSGAAISLRGRFRVLRDGAKIGRYELRLRRAR